MNDLATQARQILIETFRIDSNALPPVLDADSIPAWDSLGHMDLISRLEKAFAIEIPHNEGIDMLSEGDIIGALTRLTRKNS